MPSSKPMFGRLRPRKKPTVVALSASTFAGRKQIAEDTRSRFKIIIKEHASAGASLSSTFIDGQVEPLSPLAESSDKFPGSTVEVVNSDAFTLARTIIAEDNGAKGKTTVLNLASDEAPAGGWLYSLSKTQVCPNSLLEHRGSANRLRLIPLIGRGSMLLLHLILDIEEVVLPLAKRRPRLNRWGLLSWGCHLQTGSGPRLSGSGGE